MPLQLELSVFSLTQREIRSSFLFDSERDLVELRGKMFGRQIAANGAREASRSSLARRSPLPRSLLLRPLTPLSPATTRPPWHALQLQAELTRR